MWKLAAGNYSRHFLLQGDIKNSLSCPCGGVYEISQEVELLSDLSIFLNKSYIKVIQSQNGLLVFVITVIIRPLGIMVPFVLSDTLHQFNSRIILF